MVALNLPLVVCLSVCVCVWKLEFSSHKSDPEERLATATEKRAGRRGKLIKFCPAPRLPLAVLVFLLIGWVPLLGNPGNAGKWDAFVENRESPVLPGAEVQAIESNPASGVRA